MSGDKKIIVPGTDRPGSLTKVLESLADQQRVATLIVRRGERFLLKIVEIRKEVVVGEVRCLNWSADMTRRIYANATKDQFGSESGRREMLLADAVDKFGGDAHRYRVYIPIEDVTAVYEDLDDRFDQTPFLPLP
ncbi:MAG: hypothetical protein L6R48_24745 [Planctomycetes bacterium]|nr:hypothetical protein [Planctomycetota bacterium]